MAIKLKPVSIAGIEFDALISEDKNYTADIPEYPTEEGFPVSDTIVLKPIEINMELYVTNTPVTWLKRHGSGINRVNEVCKKLEELYFSKKLVKVMTTDTIYTNMGITSIAIAKSKEIGFARQITISMKKVYTTKRETVYIPAYLLKSGQTAANAGSASVSSTTSSSNATTKSKEETTPKQAKSILYGIASNFNFI